MRHFAYHTLLRLIPFSAPNVYTTECDTDGYWENSVWPALKPFDSRRFLNEGRMCFRRPYIRPMRVANQSLIRVDIGLFLPEDPNRFAFSEEQIRSLVQMGYQVYWPSVPVAWRTITLDGLANHLNAVLSIFADFRLECRTGPMKRIDLNVPYEKKDEAKFYFAKWDRITTSWYVPEFMWNQGLAQFSK